MQRWAARAPAPKAWSGLNMFKENQLHYDDRDRLRAYDNFKSNLAHILRAGRGADVPVILSTVGSNLKDCAPFASLHTRTLSETQMSQWDRFFQDGIALETAGSYQKALRQFAQASAIDSQHAELQFRMGSCHLALTNADQALREFELARDDDALDFRADARINQIINNAAHARAGKGVYFLDAARMLAQNSPGEIPGNELFYDHVHLNFAGNYLLGRGIAEQTAKLLPKSILARGKNEWVSAETCDRRLAVSPWDRYGVWQESFGRVAVPPFTDQLNSAGRARFYMSVLNDLGPQMNAAAEKESRAMYKDALSRNPDDYFLRDNFAQFLSETGDLAGAVQEEQQVGELLPQTPLPLYKIGLLLVQLGKISEAAESFSRALKIRNNYTPALNELALILANQQKTTEAEQAFNRILRMNPGLLDAYLDWGFIEQNEGKLDQAMAHYLNASELQPSGPAGWFYQAVVAAREHQRTDAVNDFNAAVWMKPGFWQARYLLGMELAAMGKIDEAQAQFSKVVRIRPDFARAHLNDGVALARQGKLEDALKEFQATLRLNPGDKIAQQNLEVVQRDIQLHKDGGQ
jgi:tetratricopeptide (TPR) repeat protein